MVDPGLHQISTFIQCSLSTSFSPLTHRMWSATVSDLFTDEILQVDVKLQTVDMPRQLVLTKDNLQVSIDSTLNWIVKDPYVVQFLVADVRTSLIERTQVRAPCFDMVLRPRTRVL